MIPSNAVEIVGEAVDNVKAVRKQIARIQHGSLDHTRMVTGRAERHVAHPAISVLFQIAIANIQKWSRLRAARSKMSAQTGGFGCCLEAHDAACAAVSAVGSADCGTASHRCFDLFTGRSRLRLEHLLRS